VFDWLRPRERASLHNRLSELEISVRKLQRLVDDLDADLAAWKKREGKARAQEARTAQGQAVSQHGATSPDGTGPYDPSLHHPNARVRALYARRRARSGISPASESAEG